MIDIARMRNFTEFKKLDEVELQLALDSAIKDFERGTRRFWSREEDYIELQNIDMGSSPIKLVWFKLYPITSISLIEWSHGETESDAETVNSNDYNLRADIGKVIRNNGFLYPFIKATITGGYTNDEIWTRFPNIVEAIIYEIRYKLKRESDLNIAITSQAFDKGQTNLRKDKHHPRFTEIMRTYRRLV
jgi:hypothetical protein